MVDDVKADWKISVGNACAALRIDHSLYTDNSQFRPKAKLRDHRTVATAVNQTSAMDCVHHQLATGRKRPKAG